jgi:ATP-dependent DNA ligase
MLRMRTLPAGFIAPCLPTKTDTLPSGSQWLHEIKHDGFRIIARKTGTQVRLYSRPGNDLTRRFPLIVETLARLRSRSCIIDGEAVACDDNGVASFNLIRYRRQDDPRVVSAPDQRMIDAALAAPKTHRVNSFCYLEPGAVIGCDAGSCAAWDA